MPGSYAVGFGVTILIIDVANAAQDDGAVAFTLGSVPLVAGVGEERLDS